MDLSAGENRYENHREYPERSSHRVSFLALPNDERHPRPRQDPQTATQAICSLSRRSEGPSREGSVSPLLPPYSPFPGLRPSAEGKRDSQRPRVRGSNAAQTPRSRRSPMSDRELSGPGAEPPARGAHEGQSPERALEQRWGPIGERAGAQGGPDAHVSVRFECGHEATVLKDQTKLARARCVQCRVRPPSTPRPRASSRWAASDPRWKQVVERRWRRQAAAGKPGRGVFEPRPGRQAQPGCSATLLTPCARPPASTLGRRARDLARVAGEGAGDAGGRRDGSRRAGRAGSGRSR